MANRYKPKGEQRQRSFQRIVFLGWDAYEAPLTRLRLNLLAKLYDQSLVFLLSKFKYSAQPAPRFSTAVMVMNLITKLLICNSKWTYSKVNKYLHMYPIMLWIQACVFLLQCGKSSKTDAWWMKNAGQFKRLIRIIFLSKPLIYRPFMSQSVSKFSSLDSR